MNYFAHAYSLLAADPPPATAYLVAGTALPDWLSAADRRVRLRRKLLPALAADADPQTAALARGARQHFADDRRFHQSRPFARLWLELTRLVRAVLGNEEGMRPGFTGHLLVEMLLDATLIARCPERLETYYRLLGAVEPARIEEIVNRIALSGTQRLRWFIGLFCRERILWDYGDDGRLRVRLDQVMRRVGLEPLPARVAEILPEARRLVGLRCGALLEGIPAEVPLAA
jgi:hypothetical protein